MFAGVRAMKVTFSSIENPDGFPNGGPLSFGDNPVFRPRQATAADL
jgi:hypothetical protein